MLPLPPDDGKAVCDGYVLGFEGNIQYIFAYFLHSFSFLDVILRGQFRHETVLEGTKTNAKNFAYPVLWVGQGSLRF